jgi:membrane protease YdiL (CAAX protease family)
MADSSRDANQNPDGVDWARWFRRHAKQPLARLPDASTRGDTIVQVALVLVGALALQLMFVVFAGALLAGVGITRESAPVVFLALVQAVGLLSFLVAGLAYLRRRDDPTLVGIRRPTGRDIRTILIGLIALGGIVYATELLFELLGFDLAQNQAVVQGKENPELFLVFIPFQFLVTGPAEELLFRGVVQGLLRRAYGVVPAIAVSSGLFSLAHYSALIGGGDLLPAFLTLFLSGVVLGTLYEYSRTLLVPMATHALWNAFVFGTLYVGTVQSIA